MEIKRVCLAKLSYGNLTGQPHCHWLSRLEDWSEELLFLVCVHLYFAQMISEWKSGMGIRINQPVGLGTGIEHCFQEEPSQDELK